MLKKAIEYVKSLARSGSSDSSKSFILLLSGAAGALVAATVCFCLVWDVASDGRIDSDLDGMGWVLLSAGGYVAGGGAVKALADRRRTGNTDGKAGG